MWIELAPWLVAMLVLIGGSGFFSASEAALFSLRHRDRRRLEEGTRAQRVAADLLKDPDRLLTAVLFWNLVINMAYFAIASIVGFRLEESEQYGISAAYGFAIGSLLTIIFCSEMLPKSLAVTNAARFSTMISPLLSIAVRIVDPVMPILQTVNLLSRRLLWNRFRREPYLAIADLVNAIDLSTDNEHLAEQERTVLHNVVAMSDIRVDEWMRPRAQLLMFRPPVSLSDLEGRMTPSGYLLITDEDGDEVAGAIDLQSVIELAGDHLERYAQAVVFLPWCATVADAFEKMRTHDRAVVVVVSEYGETIGVLTFEDILDTVFTRDPSRSSRLLHRTPIQHIDDKTWHVTGVTRLRRISRDLRIELPRSRSLTIGGVIQETQQKVLEDGDEGHWGPFYFKVLKARERGNVLIELSFDDAGSPEDQG